MLQFANVANAAVFDAVLADTAQREQWEFELHGLLRSMRPARSAVILREWLQYVQSGDLVWGHPVFADARRRELEDAEFNMNPTQVEEGILQCGRCKSKRTISYQRQMRSADEGSTTFARCVDCGNQWRHNN